MPLESLIIYKFFIKILDCFTSALLPVFYDIKKLFHFDLLFRKYVLNY